MPIIGFNFDKFLVEKKKELEPPIKVDSGMKILDVKKQDLSVGGKKEPALRFNYEFSVKYDPQQAEVLIEGHLLFAESAKKVDEVFNGWKKDKKFDPEITQLVMNNVLMRCNIKTLLLTQEVGLPPHIRLPILKAGEPPKQKPKSPVSEYTG
ncbi:hypothetical protein HOC80_05340 [archaeon]|jgi:hypothetical protein|nr:hypothetical protein [archaeon]MBT4417496.1 hypothetical protein [archaeon]